MCSHFSILRSVAEVDTVDRLISQITINNNNNIIKYCNIARSGCSCISRASFRPRRNTILYILNEFISFQMIVREVIRFLYLVYYMYVLLPRSSFEFFFSSTSTTEIRNYQRFYLFSYNVINEYVIIYIIITRLKFYRALFLYNNICIVFEFRVSLLRISEIKKFEFYAFPQLFTIMKRSLRTERFAVFLFDETLFYAHLYRLFLSFRGKLKKLTLELYNNYFLYWKYIVILYTYTTVC